MSKKVDTYRRLRALMLELGHDQTSLGRRIGLSRQQISDIPRPVIHTAKVRSTRQTGRYPPLTV